MKKQKCTPFNYQFVFRFVVVLGCLFPWAFLAHGYIPPTRIILQKITDSSGSGPFSIEQIVEFNLGLDPVTIKENWIIENDHSLRLNATMEKGLKTPLKIQYVYQGNQRWQILKGQKLSTPIAKEFAQRFFHFKNSEALASFLLKEEIIPTQYLARKPSPTKSTDFVYQPESWVRLARLDGVVNWAFGTPSTDTETYPGLWVEQDQFQIKKLRFKSGSEFVASGFREFSKGLKYPEFQIISWSNNTAKIKLVGVKSLSAKSFESIQPAQLESSNNFDSLDSTLYSQQIQEFYARFR